MSDKEFCKQHERAFDFANDWLPELCRVAEEEGLTPIQLARALSIASAALHATEAGPAAPGSALYAAAMDDAKAEFATWSSVFYEQAQKEKF